MAKKKNETVELQVQAIPSYHGGKYGSGPEIIKKPNVLARLFFITSIILIAYIVYTNSVHKNQIAQITQNYSPVSTKEKTELDLERNIVKTLYSKVKTNVLEDYLMPTLTEDTKRYLAFRQLNNIEMIDDSNCNKFDNYAMPGYTCGTSKDFSPKAFHKDDLEKEYKNLFGKNASFYHKSIQPGEVCYIGYQYIEARDQYVEGECDQLFTTKYTAKKELEKATTEDSTIKIYEKVRYYSEKGINLPDTLKNGTYIYTFKLDPDYNYIYVSKELEDK